MAALAVGFWIAGGLVDGRPRAVQVVQGRIAALAERAPAGAEILDAAGLHLVPAIIDAHVHLSVAGDPAEVARAEARAGIAAVLDLGEPLRLLPALGALAPLRVLFSGPLCTAPGGYPTQSWGRDGYGLQLADAAQAREAVATLAAAGARVIKLAFDGRYPTLAPEVAKALAQAARARGLRVAAHALDADGVRRAFDAGADVLAHAPLEKLPEELIRAGVVVISTLKAFGATAAAIDNVRRFKSAGARIVYGTDLGNTGTSPGIDAAELRLLAAAGLSPAAIVRAATSAPAELLGLSDLGAIAPGKAASILALAADPALDAAALARPAWVMLDGARQ